jgi:hypothetical protein
MRKICAGAEGWRSSSNNDNSHCVIGIGHFVNVAERATHGSTECITRLWSIQSCDKNTIVAKFTQKISCAGL